MNIMDEVRAGAIPDIVKKAALTEHLSARELAEKIADGTVVVPASNRFDLPHPCAVGGGTRIKVNANIGTSMDISELDGELEKLAICIECKADAVMDLSTGGNLRLIRQKIRQACPVPLGSVPIYETFSNHLQSGTPMRSMTAAEMLEAVRLHGEDGIDFVTVHCGVTKRVVEHLRKTPRVAGVVSRGGSTLARWIAANNKENPYYECFDELLAICREYEMTLSLGDGLRPGGAADAGDRAQVEELYTLGELVLRAREAGVQTMVEGPGHVPMQDIEAQIRMQKISCHNAPFYVLGPLVTDVAAGYDHIACAIGGAIAARAGADFLCYVTPAEHLRLPTGEDVRQGVIASRIAAHAADIARGIPGAAEWDLEMSRARRARDWEKQLELAMDPVMAKRRRAEAVPEDSSVCTMCSGLCALKDEEGLF